MPGGHSSFFGLLNTFVHIIMYTYYMLAAMGPEMQKYLWWKKYLTQVDYDNKCELIYDFINSRYLQLQMVQFVGIFTHCFQLIFHNPCNYSMIFVYWIGGHGVLFYFLFRNFYNTTYVKPNKKDVPDSKKVLDDNENFLEYKKSSAFEVKRDSITQLNKALSKHL